MSNKIGIIILVIVLIIMIGAIIYSSRRNKLKHGGYTGFNIFIVGEKGTEYIIPNWMINRPDVIETVNNLEQIRKRGNVN